MCIVSIVFFGYAVGCACDCQLVKRKERYEKKLLRDAGINGFWSRRRIQQVLAESVAHGIKLDLDRNGEDGKTALMSAVAAQRDHVVHLLLCAGATPDVVYAGKTALELLFDQEPRKKNGIPDIRLDIAKELLDAVHTAASVDGYLAQEEKRHEKDGLYSLIQKTRARVSREHELENNMLLGLAESGNDDAVKAYLSQAVACDVLVDAVKQTKFAAIMALVRAGVDPNAPSTVLEYPLLAAVQTGNSGVVKVLTESGARWDIVNGQLQKKLRNPANLEELQKLVSLHACIDGFQDMIEAELQSKIKSGPDLINISYLRELLPVAAISKEIFDQAWGYRSSVNGKLVLDALTALALNKQQVHEWLLQAQEQERKVLAQQEEERERQAQEYERLEQERKRHAEEYAETAGYSGPSYEREEWNYDHSCERNDPDPTETGLIYDTEHGIYLHES